MLIGSRARIVRGAARAEPRPASKDQSQSLPDEPGATHGGNAAPLHLLRARAARRSVLHALHSTLARAGGPLWRADASPGASSSSKRLPLAATHSAPIRPLLRSKRSRKSQTYLRRGGLRRGGGELLHTRAHAVVGRGQGKAVPRASPHPNTGRSWRRIPSTAPRRLSPNAPCVQRVHLVVRRRLRSRHLSTQGATSARTRPSTADTYPLERLSEFTVSVCPHLGPPPHLDWRAEHDHQLAPHGEGREGDAPPAGPAGHVQHRLLARLGLLTRTSCRCAGTHTWRAATLVAAVLAHQPTQRRISGMSRADLGQISGSAPADERGAQHGGEACGERVRPEPARVDLRAAGRR